MKDCNEIKNLLNEYLDGEIKEISAVRKHLESCADCSGAFERLKEERRLVQKAFIKGEVSAYFNKKLIEKIQKNTKPGFNFSSAPLKFTYALAIILTVIGLFLFFFSPLKDKVVTPGPSKQVLVYFTKGEHMEVENIFASNNLTEEEVLINLFEDH